VTSPQAVHLEISGDTVDEVEVLPIVEECFEDYAGVCARLIAGHYELF
jgi:hypothetical protein